jgi:hypothetical protein
MEQEHRVADDPYRHSTRRCGGTESILEVFRTQNLEGLHLDATRLGQFF